jgi:acyl-CoA dehydrogenase
VTAGKNIANEARDTLRFDGLALSADAARPVGDGVSRAGLYQRGALARATMMSGAMENAMDLACTYAQQRVQFGRPISKFQAVQHNLAVLASQTAAAVAAANMGIQSLNRDAERQAFTIAMAKTRVGEAATLVCELAHQAHGAIGFTKEYALQLSTRRLWSWREEFGSDPEWAARVGAYFCGQGADELWPILTA